MAPRSRPLTQSMQFRARAVYIWAMSRRLYMAYCLGLAVGCAADPLPARQGQLDTSDPYALVLSDHDECLPDGEVLPGDVFIAFIEADGRQPTRSEDRSGGTPSASDSRAAEP
jgi:hypothetical protein